MKFTIRNKYNDSVMFEVEADSFVKAVEKKVAERANLGDAYLGGAYLGGANLRGAYLGDANLGDADLGGAYLGGAYLGDADLRGANLGGANLRGANLGGANLRGAYLGGAYLGGAYLRGANLRGAYLRGANLRGANLGGANLTDTKGLVKIMGVAPGNTYWKRFDKGLNNNSYQFFVGLNTLRDGEVFAADDRIACSHPGFHFASRSWCAVNYPDRPLEARIRIPDDAQINEPWTSDGKASASEIEILQVFEVATGKDVTDEYRRPDGKAKRTRKVKS